MIRVGEQGCVDKSVEAERTWNSCPTGLDAAGGASVEQLQLTAVAGVFIMKWLLPVIFCSR